MSEAELIKNENLGGEEREQKEQKEQNIRQSSEGKRNWYAIYTSVGYENAVVKNLKQRIKSMGMEDYIFDVLVPTEKIVKVRRGKKVEEESKIYPGYVLVDMIVTDRSWWVVRNTPRVSGFLGTGVHPVPVSDKEMLEVIERMKGEKSKKASIDMEIGDPVKIISGPFKGSEGKILEIDEVVGLMKVSVSLFGRETEVELDFSQVQPI